MKRKNSWPFFIPAGQQGHELQAEKHLTEKIN